MKAITGRGEGTTPVITACMSRSWKVEVCPQKNELTRRDDQSAISTKEYIKYEATQTYLSVMYQHDHLHLTGKRPQQRSQGPQQQQNTPPIFLQRVFSGKKNTKRCDTGTNACHSLVFSGDIILSTCYDLRVAQLNNRRNYYFFPCFLCQKCIPCFLVHPPAMT